MKKIVIWGTGQYASYIFKDILMKALLIITTRNRIGFGKINIEYTH